METMDPSAPCEHNNPSMDALNEDNDNDLIGTFELDDIFEYRQVDENSNNYEDAKNFNNKVQNHPYVKKILKTSGLFVHFEKSVLKAWKEQGALGLFHLFLQKEFLDTVRKWTNKSLLMKRDEKEVQKTEFYNYMGLELGTSLIHMNRFKDYWGPSMFDSTPSSFYSRVMGYKRFIAIRGSLRFTPPETSQDTYKTSTSPLWHSEPLLNHFYKRCANVATPLGPVALDENGASTKARSSAKSYLPNKPDKYAIRFYSVVSNTFLYLFSMFDNNRGNSTGMNPVDRYAYVHRELKRVVSSKFNDKSKTKPGDISRDSASALWATQLAHMTMKAPMSDVNIEDKSRRIFTDNFYTRHALGEKMKELSNELKLCGTVRLNFVDEVNKVNVTKGIEMMRNAKRGDWVLVPAFNFDRNHEKDKNAFLKEQKKNRTRQKYEPKMGEQAENAGFVLFMDSKLCIFYSNDLACTPSRQNISSRHSDDKEVEDAWECMHGRAPLRRYPPAKDGVKGDIGRIVYQVPAVIVAYNYFMCMVDLMDQRRANLVTKRKERRVQMSLWTMILDLASHQGYAIYEWITVNYPEKAMIVMNEKISKKLTFYEFKKKIVEGLVEDKLKKRNVCKRKSSSEEPKPHLLCSLFDASNKENKPQMRCEVCNIVGDKRLMTSFYCDTCKVGFHPACFNVYHNRDNYADWKDKMNVCEEKFKKKRNCLGSKYFTGKIVLPHMK